MNNKDSKEETQIGNETTKGISSVKVTVLLLVILSNFKLYIPICFTKYYSLFFVFLKTFFLKMATLLTITQ